MRAEIDYIISKLNPDSDILLIHLLQQKLRAVEHYDVKITDKEIERALVGINRIINSTLSSIHADNPIVKKIKKILDNVDCNTCKYHIEETSYYYGSEYKHCKPNNENPVCNSCTTRAEKLEDISWEIRDKLDFNDTELGEDFIKSKALLNKISNKLKQVKQ